MREAETTPMARLTRRPEFLRVAASRRKAAAPGLVLQALHRDDGEPLVRIGYTASKKVGNAVARNRARRRLREVVRAVLPTLGVPGTDYVVIARAATVSRPYSALLSDFEGAVRRLSKPARRGQIGTSKPQPDAVAS